MMKRRCQNLTGGRVSPSCSPTWDSLLCWPRTTPGTMARMPCFSELNGIKYDTSKNASRWCHVTGEWDSYTNYTACQTPQHFFELPPDSGVEVTTFIYAAGYTISLVVLMVAMVIFLIFKDLWCLRNTIHKNLMCTFIATNSMWILNFILQGSVQSDFLACTTLFLLHYCHLTSFFWMFVEGLYLYLMVVKTFAVETVKLSLFAFIGWGIPVIVVTAWGVAKILVHTSLEESQAQMGAMLSGHCSLMIPHFIDWIYQSPVFTVLTLNLLFLVRIMWVLITKLRSAHTVETQQYRKASKALLVLIPLLGITYILVIVGPTNGLPAYIYAYVRAILLSTQGFAVALFYCFLNTEVRATVRHHLDRWQDERNLRESLRMLRLSKDYDLPPFSRPESYRFHHGIQPASTLYVKREPQLSSRTVVAEVEDHESPRASNASVGSIKSAFVQVKTDCVESEVYASTSRTSGRLC